MKEIRDILDAVDGFRDDEKAVLATVLDVRGSGYRLPGARMLILADDRTLGTVSGGCLEADVLDAGLAADRDQQQLGHPVVGDETYGKGKERGFSGATRGLMVGHIAPEAAQGGPLAAVREYLSAYRVQPVEGLPRFSGGLVGWFGADLVRYIEPRLMRDRKPGDVDDVRLLLEASPGSELDEVASLMDSIVGELVDGSVEHGVGYAVETRSSFHTASRSTCRCGAPGSCCRTSSWPVAM